MAEQTVIHLETYTPSAKSLVAAAQSLADDKKHSQVEPLHLFARFLEQSEVAPIFQKLGVDLNAVSSAVGTALDRLAKSDRQAYLSSDMLELLKRAEKEGGGSVGLDNLINALSQEIRSSAGQVLQQFSLGPGIFRDHASTLKKVEVVRPDQAGFTNDMIAQAKNGKFGPIIGRDSEIRRLLQVLSRQNKNNPLLVGESGSGKTAIVQEIAKRFAKEEVPSNLAKMALIELDLAALTSGAKSRTEIDERVKQILKQKDRNVILLIEGLENLINQTSMLNLTDLVKTLLSRADVRIFGTTTPDGLRKLTDKDQTLVRKFTTLSIEPPTVDQAIEILRGISSRFEKYHSVKITESAITSAVNLAKRYVQDKALPDSAVDLLDEASARKRVEITGMPSELDKDIRRLDSLKTQRDQLSNDPDPKSKKALDAIEQEIATLEPKVKDLQANLDTRRNTIVALTNTRALYEKALADMEKARREENYAKLGELEHRTIPDLKKKLETAEESFNKGGYIDVSNLVGEQEVAQVLGDWTGIPVSKMLEGETEKLLSMEDRIQKRLVGQDEAVKQLSVAVRRSRVGLRDPRKPIGSFLFLGASGCGKTELAKATAEFLFDDEQAMHRFDMSEFMEKHMSQRLIGSPVGYVGSEDGGELTEAVKRHPYSVLLFDEIEKAHGDVFNMLLQVLDDGRLTDGRGRTADFSNTVVIMTSNIGSKRLLDADEALFESKEGREELREQMMLDMKDYLRPEFINRIDNILLFKPLTKASLKGIVDIEIKKVERLVKEHEYKLSLTDKAKDALVDMSYEPAFGARPLKRSIIEKVQNPLAEAILHKGMKTGSIITIDVDSNNEFTFSA